MLFTSPSPAGAAWLSHVDPRVRVLAALGLSLLAAAAFQPAAVAIILLGAALGLPFCGLPPRVIARRLIAFNLVMLLLLLVLPWTTPGRPWSFFAAPTWFPRWWPSRPSVEGLVLAGTIAMKGNAIMLLLLGLVSPMDPIVFGHALSHLRVPDKLTHLLLFAVRYVEVLHDEYLRLRAAMRTRGFRPRANRHTYRTFGHLAGMLLVRSHDRAERIAAAMRCRGFRGRFHLLDHFTYTRADLPFALAAAGVALAAAWVAWFAG